MKYERLTERDRYWECEKSWQYSHEPAYEEIENIYHRLAELEDKIEAGTLVELPCKAGDTVYIVYSAFIQKWEVSSVQICEDENKMLFRLGHKGTDDYNAFWSGEIGKYVFLTKAEAEKRLEELRGER